jgi:LysR family glycine cleavage system transcriptional activator
MTNRLPPLNALRVFEVAARHLSFTAAARDLHVTTAAVSHQIKQLEESLNLSLFKRRNNQLELTVAGETYLPKVREAFRTLRESTEQLIGFSSVTVRIAMRQALCDRWLIPRLARFYDAHPGIHLEIKTEFEHDYLLYDFTVEYRPVSAPDYVVQQLFSTPLYPVCSPEYAARVQSVADLERVALLHDRPLQGMPDYPDWQRWLQAAGVGGVSNSRGATFSSSLMCLRAAEEGVGVALGQHALVAQAVASGRLVVPLQLAAPVRMPYYLIYPTPAIEKPGVLTLIQWLQAEAGRSGLEP